MQLAEVMLRYHSQMKMWYAACSAANETDYEEGFFMDQGSLWKMIINNRLSNGKLNIVNLSRLLSKYGRKEFDLHFEAIKLKDEIDLIQKYDFESTEIESELSRFDDPQYMVTKLENLVVEDYIYEKKRRLNQYSSSKILLFRAFINALIRRLR